MDLDSMKYADLRNLAKELGLKANGKADKLMKAIRKHYQQKKPTEEQGCCNVNVPDASQKVTKDNAQDDEEETSSISVFVNTRRVRRKLTNTTECGAKMTPNAAEVINKLDACSTPCSSQGNKKRKSSPLKNSEKNETKSEQIEGEQQRPGSKDEAPVHDEAEEEKGKGPVMVKVGKIPRYQGFQQKSKTMLKPVTPNFKKIHEAQFNKMESIDTYVQRKTKWMEPYRSTVKDLKDLSEKKQPEGKIHMSTSRTHMQPLFSPAPVNKKQAEEKCRHTLHSVSKSLLGGNKDLPFRPSVLSTRRISVRFSEATCDNEFKRSLVKTPARMSAYMTSSTPQKQTAKSHSVNSSILSAQKTPGPFIFTGNAHTLTTPGTQKKPHFDLKASLSRPLNYKPHKGKLQPFGEAKENKSANKSLISSTRQESYKQRKVLSRDDRRIKQAEDRKQKKQNLLGARRGLTMK